MVWDSACRGCRRRGSGADGVDEGCGCCVCRGVGAQDVPECVGEERGGVGGDAAMCRDAEHREEIGGRLSGFAGDRGVVACVEHAKVDRGGDGESEVRHEELRTSKDSFLSTLLRR